jgi:WD40 repeat protein
MQRLFCTAFALLLLASVLQAEETPLVVELKGDHVESATFSPDGKKVITASNDSIVRIWDAESGKQLRVLEGHEDRG